MNKAEFLSLLAGRLRALPSNEVEKSIEFYCELIDDSVENGTTEEDAVAHLGNMDEIVDNITSEIPITTIIKAKVKEKEFKSSNKALWIILAILASPIWLSISLAIFGVILSIYVTIWSLLIALYAIVLSFGCCVIAGIVAGVGFIINGNIGPGLISFGVGLIFGSIGILTVQLSIFLTKQLVVFTKWCIKKVKSLIFNKKTKEGLKNEAKSFN